MTVVSTYFLRSIPAYGFFLKDGQPNVFFNNIIYIYIITIIVYFIETYIYIIKTSQLIKVNV